MQDTDLRQLSSFLRLNRAPIRLLWVTGILYFLFSGMTTLLAQTATSNSFSRITPPPISLSGQYPLLDHLQPQKDFLLKHSLPASTPFRFDGEALEGNFNSGIIPIALGDSDGEPTAISGYHPEHKDVYLEFTPCGLVGEALFDVIPGEVYRIHWVETIIDLRDFYGKRYRGFVAIKIEGKGILP